MIHTIIDVLPLAACLFWMLLHAVLAYRTNTFLHSMALMGMCILYLFSDCCYYDPSASYALLTTASNLSQFSAPCVIPLVMLYIHSLRTGKKDRTIQLTWVFVPVILLTVAELTTTLAGRDNMEVFIEALYTGRMGSISNWSSFPIRMYYYFAVIVFRVVLVVEVLAMLLTFLRHWRIDGYAWKHVKDFFFHKGRINVVELQYFNLIPAFVLVSAKLFLFRDFLVAHLWVTSILSILMTLFISPFCFATLFGAKKTITFREMWYGFIYNYRPENKSQVIEEIVAGVAEDSNSQTLMHIQDIVGLDLEREAAATTPVAFMTDHALVREIFSAVPKTPEEESLMARFEKLMTVERVFLQPGLTLIDVADRLETNKSYVSKLVNNTYKLAFPDMINTLRIDYAEEYIVSHRDATQAEIAVACGFPSASSLNSAFKKVTGMTPRIWLASYDLYHPQQ